MAFLTRSMAFCERVEREKGEGEKGGMEGKKRGRRMEEGITRMTSLLRQWHMTQPELVNTSTGRVTWTT